MEHEVTIKITRYVEGATGDPEPIQVYETTKFITDGVDPNIFDLFDEAKFDASHALRQDIERNCTHEGLEEEVQCPVCFVTAEELKMIASEAHADDLAHNPYGD